MNKQTLAYSFEYHPEISNSEIEGRICQAIHGILLKFIKENKLFDEMYTFRFLSYSVTQDIQSYGNRRGMNELTIYYEFVKAERFIERYAIPEFNKVSLIPLTYSAVQELKYRARKNLQKPNKITRLFNWLEKKLEMKL